MEEMRLTFDQMYQLFREGLIGTKEFRNWLERADKNFAAVRDADVDNRIDALARLRDAEIEAQRDNLSQRPQLGGETGEQTGPGHQGSHVLPS